MFCGKGDKTWNEDGLDLHYWKECPLLAPCPGCAQIVEIAGLPDHLLDECEQKQNYEPCDVTGNMLYFVCCLFFKQFILYRPCNSKPRNVCLESK